MTGTRPAPALACRAAPAVPGMPGPDEITLSLPRGHRLCHGSEHQAVGALAEVLVTFGQLGTGQPGELWPEVWGRTFALCAACWQITGTVATARRPCLIICDTRPRATAQSAP